jgi:hypothetical protein
MSTLAAPHYTSELLAKNLESQGAEAVIRMSRLRWNVVEDNVSARIQLVQQVKISNVASEHGAPILRGR